MLTTILVLAAVVLGFTAGLLTSCGIGLARKLGTGLWCPDDRSLEDRLRDE